MTEQELVDIVYAELKRIVEAAPAGANVPIDEGTLRDSIKLRQVGPTQWQVYVDEEQAPYAGKVNEYNHYWARVHQYISSRLAASLGKVGRRE